MASDNVWQSDKVCVAIMQHLLLAADVLLNIFSDFHLTSQFGRLSLFLFQDVAQIVQLIVLLLLLFQKSIVNRKLLRPAAQQFAPALSVCLLYFLLTVGWQSTGWQPQQWSRPYRIIVLVLQRLLSAVHYAFYRSASDQLLGGDFVKMTLQKQSSD
jgi:hypothetical protein